MEYIYAVMLLHKAGKQADKASVKKVLEAAGVKVDEAKLNALVASLEGVDIDKVVKEALNDQIHNEGLHDCGHCKTGDKPHGEFEIPALARGNDAAEDLQPSHAEMLARRRAEAEARKERE